MYVCVYRPTVYYTYLYKGAEYWIGGRTQGQLLTVRQITTCRWWIGGSEDWRTDGGRWWWVYLQSCRRQNTISL